MTASWRLESAEQPELIAAFCLSVGRVFAQSGSFVLPERRFIRVLRRSFSVVDVGGAGYARARNVKALVTGGGGFLGKYLVRRLISRGDCVRVFSRRSYSSLQQLGVEQRLGDVRDVAAVSRACEGMDVVFHTAAIAGIWGSWNQFFGINTEGTRNVIAGCREHHVAKLVYTSSPSVTFDAGDQCDVDESIPYASRWLCHYPHSKALAEQSVLQANRVGDLTTCALRPHLIWGPEDPHLVPRLIARARIGRLRRVGERTNRVDMIYVENAAEAHLMAAEALVPDSPVAGRAYFISQGEPVNCWQWINQILTLAGLSPVDKHISFNSAWHLGYCLELGYGLLRLTREPPMTRFLAAQLAKSHLFNIRRARDDFGYAPRVSTEEGMRRLEQWLKVDRSDCSSREE